MATRGREVLRGKLYYRTKRSTAGAKKKKVVGAFCGLGNSEANKSSISAQIQIFDDYEKIEKPGFKPKNFIRLENAKIESSYFSPSTSNTNSPAYSSTIASPQGGMRLSASPSPSVGSASSQSSAINGSELYAFTVATSNGEVHEFRTESENDRLRWVKLLQLLVMYPFSLIPEEPSTNPIKDNFRQALEAKQYGADSVWPVYILPEEVGSKCGIIGLHILVLRSGIPNVSMGKLEIINPTDHQHPAVTWDRDKMRRTGKTGHLVFIEIGRRCDGGPGLIWMYTGYQNDAQALRETLHKFLFQGDGSAVAMNSQPQSLYDVPRSSVDTHPHSLNKRNSTSSGYHNHLLTRSKSHDRDSGFHSMDSVDRTPPLLDGPPVRWDKHPSFRRKRESDPCMIRRSSSVQSPSNSFTEGELFECENEQTILGNSSQPFFPTQEEPDGLVTGNMDGETDSNGRHLYDTIPVGRSHSHPHYTANAPEATGDQYMCMIHPKYRSEGYIYMRPASQGSPKKSALYDSVTQHEDEYNTLQHFSNRQSRSNSATTLDTLPTIREGKGLSQAPVQERSSNYENHPLPEDLKGLEPRNYRPAYENHDGVFKGRGGSHGLDSYENITSQQDSVQKEVMMNSNGNNNATKKRFSLRRRSSEREDVSLRSSSKKVDSSYPSSVSDCRQVVVGT